MFLEWCCATLPLLGGFPEFARLSQLCMLIHLAYLLCYNAFCSEHWHIALRVCNLVLLFYKLSYRTSVKGREGALVPVGKKKYD